MMQKNCTKFLTHACYQKCRFGSCELEYKNKISTSTGKKKKKNVYTEFK